VIRPDIDGRLAMRIREIAELEADSAHLTGAEKRRILEQAADLLEEYIIAAGSRP